MTHIGPLGVTFHRTVRVADSRTPSSLPPSLGHIRLYKVSDFRTHCPAAWDRNAYFMALHDVEAMWMSFSSPNLPCAVVVGAGGINALTGKKLGTKLVDGGYLVTPPQPWLDGWKGKDGSVYQFVATPYQKGEGKSVGEQILKKGSKTGAIGIAVFEAKDGRGLAKMMKPEEVSGWGSGYLTLSGASATCDSFFPEAIYSCNSIPVRSSGVRGMSSSMSLRHAAAPVAEMGIGKGGKIVQKIYEDPYGLDVWKTKPSATFSVYLVDAATVYAITGEHVPAPRGHEDYHGAWFGVQDGGMKDVAGSVTFTKLESVTPTAAVNPSVFPGDTTNVRKKGKRRAVAA